MQTLLSCFNQGSFNMELEFTSKFLVYIVVWPWTMLLFEYAKTEFG